MNNLFRILFPRFLSDNLKSEIQNWWGLLLSLSTNRLPIMCDAREYVQVGGLISYAADARDLFRRSSMYVDKILKGAKPADLPVEQPTKFELVINLKTAKQIGLTIPPNVLARADKVIK